MLRAAPLLVAVAAAARPYCKEPHADHLQAHRVPTDYKLALLGIYYNDVEGEDRPTEADLRAWYHNDAAVAYLEEVSDGCLDDMTVEFFVAENGIGHGLGAGCDDDEFFKETYIAAPTNGGGRAFNASDYDGIVVLPLGYCTTSAWAGAIALHVDERTEEFSGVYMGRDLGGPGWRSAGDGDDACEDDAAWSAGSVDCAYIAEDPAARCAYVDEKRCPKTCGACSALASTYMHELFHMMGAQYHATGLVCHEPERDFQDLLHRCADTNYGDFYDVMGSGNGFAPNLQAAIRYDMGWMGKDDVEFVETSGEYAIYPLNGGPGSHNRTDPKKRALFFATGPGVPVHLTLEWRTHHDAPGVSAAVLERNPGFFVRSGTALVDADVASCEPFGDDEKLRTTLLPDAALVLHMDGTVVKADKEGPRDDGTMAVEIRFTGERQECHRGLPAMHTGYFGEYYNCGSYGSCAGDGGDGQYCDAGACGDHGNFWAPFYTCHDECLDETKVCDDYDFRGHPSVGYPLTPDATMDSGYAYPCWDKDLGDVPADLRDACYQMFQGRCTAGTRFARVSHHHISHLANADRDPGCHGDEGEFDIELVASTLDGVGFEVQKDPSWYSQFPMRRLNMAPGDGRQVHFAYGIPDATPDGTYDSCISITNTFTGLRKGFLHRLTLGQPFDEFRHNRLASFGPVDYDGDGDVSAGEQGLFLAIEAACDGLAGCAPGYPDCEWDWHPDFCHVEDEVACDGADAALGTEDRCWEASWSPDDAAHYAYRGRDQCENLGAFCKGGAKILEAETCDDPLLMPCKNQEFCFQDTTAWTELGRTYDYAGRVVSALDYDADASLEPWATPGPCQTAWTLDPLRDALPTAPVGSNFLCGEDGAGGANSLHGTAFCEHTASKADVDALGWTWPEETAAFPHARWAGFIQEGHACWAQGEPDVECAKRLCEETDECGGLTVGWVEKDAPMSAPPEERRGRPFFVYFLQRGLIGRPDLDSFNNWNKRGEGSGSTEIACLYKPQASSTADECTCFGVYLDGTSPIVPSGACPKPTPAPSPAPISDTTTTTTMTTTTTTAALSAAPTPAPTGDAAAATCEDDADWLAQSNKKAKKKCAKKTTKKKCKKKCAWIEDACVEKLQTCEDLFYKKGKPQKEGAKLVKTCKKQGTIGGATSKKASAACQKACGTCDDVGEFGQGDGDFVASGDEYGPDCSTKRGRDSESWHRKDTPTKTCKWVERKPTTRCRKKGATGARAVAECVRACASCPSEGACADDATWSHTNKKNKKIDCVSVARNPGRRCGMPGAKAACPATCGTC